jgi:hypothetical protein
VTSPTMPGLELRLPAGTVIRGEDHEVVTAVSLTPIPLDRTPFPLPQNATFSMFFTIQPGGAYLSTPGPIRGGWLVYPNVNHSRSGPAAAQWHERGVCEDVCLRCDGPPCVGHD